MNLYEKLFDEKAIDEFFSKAVQKQEEKVAQRIKIRNQYYEEYPFLLNHFHYKSKLLDIPLTWTFIHSLDEFEILTKMYEELYNTDTTPNMVQEYKGWGTYGIAFNDEFCELKFYKLDDYMKEMYELREKMMKLSN